MNYKTKFSEEEVYSYMIDNMSDEQLEKTILENNTLRLKYGAFDKKAFKYIREKAIDTIKSLIYKNKTVREEITDVQDILAIAVFKELLSEEDIEVVKREMKKARTESEAFKMIIALWQNPLEEINELGDKLFKDCRMGKYNKKEDKEEKKMEDIKKNVLSMNLAECIEIISKHEEKIKDYEKRLKEKDKAIEELKILLTKATDNKDYKKDLTKLSNVVKQETKDLKENNQNIVKTVETFKKEIAEVKSEVAKQAAANDTNNKLLLNELIKTIKDMQNTISSNLMEDNRKSLKEIKAELKKEIIRENNVITPVFNNSEDKKDKIYNVEKEKATGVKNDFDTEIDELLGDIL